MKEISTSEDLLHLKVIELMGMLAAMTVEEDCKSVTMLIQRIGSSHGNFEFNITCEKLNEDLSLTDKIKRWFK